MQLLYSVCHSVFPRVNFFVLTNKCTLFPPTHYLKFAYTFTVAPKWLISPPSQMEVIQGQDVTIDCQASGFPSPRIWWEQQSLHTNSQNNNNQNPEHQHQIPSASSSSSSVLTSYQPVISNSQIHALENGSLIMKSIQRRVPNISTVSFVCQATNGIGSGISQVVTITIRMPPQFKSTFTQIVVRKGEDVSLTCDPESGDSPIRFSWLKDRIPLIDEPNSAGHQNNGMIKYQMSDVSESSASATVISVSSSSSSSSSSSTSLLSSGSVLRIRDVDRRDSSLFTCIASNPYGSAELNIQLLVQGTFCV